MWMLWSGFIGTHTHISHALNETSFMHICRKKEKTLELLRTSINVRFSNATLKLMYLNIRTHSEKYEIRLIYTIKVFFSKFAEIFI